MSRGAVAQMHAADGIPAFHDLEVVVSAGRPSCFPSLLARAKPARTCRTRQHTRHRGVQALLMQEQVNLCTRYVCLWPKADIGRACPNVRFGP
jgi:hypothetical protein